MPFTLEFKVDTNQAYLKKLSKQETLAVMATLLAEDYLVKKEYEKAMMISDVILKYHKENVGAMLMKGSLFYLLLDKHYKNKYPMPKLIPVDERPYYEFLSASNLNRDGFQKQWVTSSPLPPLSWQWKYAHFSNQP